MAYWVHGRDEKTGRPDSMLIAAETPDEAREQAAAKGLIAETIQLQTHPETDSVSGSIPKSNLPQVFRRPYKLFGITLFILGFIVLGIYWAYDLKNGMMGFVEGFACVLFTLSFYAWGMGCLFQSRSLKSLKFGCITGVLMFFSVLITFIVTKTR